MSMDAKIIYKFDLTKTKNVESVAEWYDDTQGKQNSETNQYPG